MKVKISIHESMASQVVVDQTAMVTLDAAPDVSLRGRVTKMAALPASVDPWREQNYRLYDAEVTLDEFDPQAKLEGNAKVTIVTYHNPNAIAVPASAVTNIGGLPYCFVRHGNQFEPIQIDLGLYNGERLEVTNGLQAGDEILKKPDLADPAAIALQENDLADSSNPS